MKTSKLIDEFESQFKENLTTITNNIQNLISNTPANNEKIYWCLMANKKYKVFESYNIDYFVKCSRDFFLRGYHKKEINNIYKKMANDFKKFYDKFITLL